MLMNSQIDAHMDFILDNAKGRIPEFFIGGGLVLYHLLNYIGLVKFMY